jgi:energy-coupling factor transporter ATP-binding protein EcfA2
MINRAELKNFGPIKELDWQNLGKINLIIGNNGCGKSFLLKALYSAVRTLEKHGRGDIQYGIQLILTDELYWTFQTDNIGDLVTRFLDDERSITDIDLEFSLILNQQKFSYFLNCNSFSKDYYFSGSFKHMENYVIPRIENSIFLPAKEFISLDHIIFESRVIKQQFGFDNTYLDLINALRIPANEIVDEDDSILSNVRRKIRAMISGRIEFDETKKRWYFIQGNQRFTMGTTAEGFRKVAALDNLLGNGYLSKNSIIFIDEPESTLHPEAISKLLDIIAILANYDIQFFIASHSYFVIKKLFLIAQEQQLSIPVLSYQDNEWIQSDLKDEMPSNPIIKESIRLYKEEVSLALK